MCLKNIAQKQVVEAGGQRKKHLMPKKLLEKHFEESPSMCFYLKIEPIYQEWGLNP